MFFWFFWSFLTIVMLFLVGVRDTFHEMKETNMTFGQAAKEVFVESAPAYWVFLIMLGPIGFTIGLASIVWAISVNMKEKK